MTISELSIRRPVTVTMIYVLVGIVAAIFIPRLAVAEYPSTSMPMISVRTTYTNAGPDEIEQNVTKVLENQLGRIQGLEDISSTSSDGQSMIMLSFGYDVDLEEATSDIESVLSRVSGMLPDDCDSPTVFKFDMSSKPIMRLTIKGDMTLDELRQIAEDDVQPKLERVDGVASTSIMGGAEKKIQVAVSQNRMQAYGLTISDVSQALAGRNVKLSGGTITEGGMDYQVLTNEYVSSLDDIRRTVVRNTVVPSSDGLSSSSRVVRVEDVADVYEDFDYERGKIYIDGVPGLYISVSNETDSNASTVAKGVTAAIQDINENLPNGVELTVISDDTSAIDSIMSQVYSSAIQGALLAIAVIFIFLRSIKSSLIIGLSMPISIVITLMCMAMFDMTINTMTMSGLILGMGMTVDSSIVILQNIHKYREQGYKSAVAAILGSRNMMTAIVASTLTTLCVFIPIIIYKAELEMLGEMFQDLVITVVISLTASLIVAVTLVPALCGSIVRIDTRTQKPLKSGFLRRADDAMEKFLLTLDNGYARALTFVLKNKFLVLTFVGMLLVFSLVQIGKLGMNFMPSSKTDDKVTVSLTLPVGTSDEITEQYLFDFQKVIEDTVGGYYTGIIVDVGTGNTGEIQINLPDIQEQKMTAAQMQAKLKPLLSRYSDATVVFSAGRMPGGSSGDVNIEITSDNLDDIETTANEIVRILKDNVPQLTDVSSDLESGSPQYRIVVDQDKADSLGVSVSSIASAVRSAISGVTATTWHIGDSEYDIVVSLSDGDLTSAIDLGNIFVQGTSGKTTLDNLVSLSEGSAPVKISRENGLRLNHVTASLEDGYTITDVQPIVERAIEAQLVLPESVEIAYSGAAADIQQFGGSLILVIIVAIVLVFAVMAAQFESLVDPFIIFVSIPLLAIGVIWVYLFTGQPFTLYSAVGIVALVGVVVNNGIILVDYTNQLVKTKMPVFEACVEAGRSRLRPILMTTLTTVVGMIPMGFFPGNGGESMQPIGMTMVGGLTTGAFLTLFVSPVLYCLFNKRREKRFDDPESLQNQLAEKIPDDVI